MSVHDEGPGGRLAARPLHFIWIADCSGSMDGEKIQSLNYAIRESIKHMREVAEKNPHAQVLVRAVRFSTGAFWHVANPTPVDQFEWADLTAGGVTDMGQAMRLLGEQLRTPPMAERALPPVLVLISDGQPTDDFSAGLKQLMDEPWGKKAVRLAISVGHDTDLDTLRAFIGNSEIQPMEARNPEQLTHYIKWASTVVIESASSPPSQTKDQAGVTVPIPPVDPPPQDPGEVW
ncbi:MAG: hypothetical protein AMXMBFR61_05450 [Fimbriimonadales bacterium]